MLRTGMPGLSFFGIIWRLLEVLSIEMEKVLNSMPTDQKIHAQRVLELNPDHEIFGKLKALSESGDKDKLGKYAKLLYDQALLIEGMSIEDPVAFSNLICELM